jgi:hypothetical protein
MLAANSELKGVELQLQGLPCSGAALQSMPALHRDNVAAVVLKRFAVEAACFDGLANAGPVPKFFSLTPEELIENGLWPTLIARPWWPRFWWPRS